MKRIAALLLVLSLAATGAAQAQTTFQPVDRYSNDRATEPYGDGAYDYARVLDVRPVTSGYRSYPASSQRCYERRDGYTDGYGDHRDDGYYRQDGYYDRDGYRDDGYRDDGYQSRGTHTGRTVATVVGGVVGAVLGSKVGGGSARYATSAIGTMVGGIAGQQVYENSVRSRALRTATVTVCDPVDDGYDTYGTRGNGVNEYDVTYEYAGRQYTSRTNYHPGDRIRVRVDVRPE